MKKLDAVTRRVRFGIATDEPISGIGLHDVLKGEDRYRVIWLPASADRLLHAVRLLSVDILLVDMACGFPADIDRQLRESGLSAPVILWVRDQAPTHNGSGKTVVLDKRVSPEMFLACVESVLSGGGWEDAEVDAPQMISEPKPAPIQISRREAELMELVAEGLSNRQIGERLQLTEGSVKVYFSRLFRKLGVSDRVGLALYSVRQPWNSSIVLGAGRGGPSKSPQK